MKTDIKFIKLNETGFQWTVLINGQSFNYFTGLGHCKRAHVLEANNKLILNSYKQLLEKQPENTLKLDVSNMDKSIKIKLIQATIPKDQGVVLWNLKRLQVVYVTIPKIDDILNCLFLDSQAGTETFEDFCLNFGYSNDSIQALDTYKACQENHFKLLRALGSQIDTK